MILCKSKDGLRLCNIHTKFACRFSSLKHRLGLPQGLTSPPFAPLISYRFRGNIYHSTRLSKSYSTMRSSTDQLIAFYKGTARDRYGRSHADILSWDRYKLEAHHNYIQTLFPLPEEGVADAPLIDKDMMDAFRSQPELKEALNQSFAKMLWFYGFEMKNDGKVNAVALLMNSYTDIN